MASAAGDDGVVDIAASIDAQATGTCHAPAAPGSRPDGDLSWATAASYSDWPLTSTPERERPQLALPGDARLLDAPIPKTRADFAPKYLRKTCQLEEGCRAPRLTP